MADHLYALPNGFRLESYEIRRVLSIGRYGIKYIATNHEDGKLVAVKEYLPDGLAVRGESCQVVPKSSAGKHSYEAGLARFLDEARAQLRIRHPNMVGAHRWLEANSTAYLVMEYVEGDTLSAKLEQQGMLPEADLLAIVHPTLDALRRIHEVGYLHQDIRPGTIVLRPDGSPILLELGGGRRNLGGARQTFAAKATDFQLLTPAAGYAALEQYSSHSRLGPWTDIYSFGAVLYHCAVGHAPPDAPSRVIKDEFVPLVKAARGDYKERTLAAIESALAISASDRPSNIGAWRAKFAASGRTASPVRGARISTRMAVRRGSAPGAKARNGPRGRGLRWIVPMACAVALIAVLTWLDVGVLPDADKVGSPVASPTTAWASLEVATTPPGAEVLLDGGKVGETPLELADLPAGVYALTLRHPLYETVELPAQQLAPGRVLRVGRKLVRATGDLEVITEPAGAWVEVDGKRWQETTPTTVTALPTGNVTVVVGSEGYSRREVPTLVAREDTRTVRVALESNIVYGTLTLVLQPADATVALLDVEPEYAPGIRLPEGAHRVRVSRVGYRTQDRSVSISGDTTATFSLTVDPQPLTVTVSPAGAQVHFVGGEATYSPGVLLPPGEYSVRAMLVGHRTWEETIRHGAVPTRRRVTLEEGVGEFKDVLSDGGRGPTMVLVPRGGFRMGCVSGEGCRRDEAPIRDVVFNAPFALSKYEVTFDDFDKFTDAVGRARVSLPRGWQRTNRPVVNVSWEDATAYANWLTERANRVYRLPSEAQWEYAARAGTSTAYNWGNELGRARANCNGCGSDWDNNSVAPVGFFAPNAWGLHDMHGNVWEWVLDCRNNSYANAPVDGSARTDGNCLRRMMRGGSWSNRPEVTRAARREWDEASLASPQIGFRLAAAAEQGRR